MNSLLKYISGFYIKNKQPLPLDIYKSIVDSTIQDRWRASDVLPYFYNHNRDLKIEIKIFFGFTICSIIPNSKYYMDRETTLKLVNEIEKNIVFFNNKDLDQERVNLKISLQRDVELDENGYKKIKCPPRRL